jgi:hypothetical protein
VAFVQDDDRLVAFVRSHQTALLSMEGDMSVPERASPSGLPANVTVISIQPIYGPDQVCFATYFGGPVGGGWLMALNYKRLGEPAKAHLATGLSVLAMAALVAIGLAIPSHPTLLLWFVTNFVMWGSRSRSRALPTTGTWLPVAAAARTGGLPASAWRRSRSVAEYSSALSSSPSSTTRPGPT